MTHSHIPIHHLLRQVEDHRQRRQGRDIRPRWLTEFITGVAPLFEPLSETGRVGFDCQLEDFWRVGMYLGSTEVIGGRNDGLSRPANFEIDVLKLLDRFTSVERFRWLALPEDGMEPAGTALSCLSIHGAVDSHPVSLSVYSIPPYEAGPGFREYPNGERRTV